MGISTTIMLEAIIHQDHHGVVQAVELRDHARGQGYCARPGEDITQVAHSSSSSVRTADTVQVPCWGSNTKAATWITMQATNPPSTSRSTARPSRRGVSRTSIRSLGVSPTL